MLHLQDDTGEETLMAGFQKQKVRKDRNGLVNLKEIRLRAEELRLLAWSPLWDTVRKQCRGNENKTRAVSQVITEVDFDTVPLTGCLRMMMNKILEIHGNKERFIIVADRIF
jgi:hypothetical protein